MTIAIGTKFVEENIVGALVCADSRVTASGDGATTFGRKSHLSISAGTHGGARAIAIASSSEDGNAANMLAGDITNALRVSETLIDHNDQEGIRSVVTDVMTEWQSHYGAMQPPGIQFVLAVGFLGNCELLYCSPPNTVVERGECFAIGTGSRPVDPLIVPLQSGVRGPTAEAAILRTAYWVHRAKRDEGAFVGGNAPMFLVSQWGRMALVNDSSVIEAFGEEVDRLLNLSRYEVLTHASDEEQRAFLADFGEQYLKLAARVRAVKFPQLEWLRGWTNRDALSG